MSHVYSSYINRPMLLALLASVDTNPEHPARALLSIEHPEDSSEAQEAATEPAKRLVRYNAKRLPTLRDQLAKGRGDADALRREEFVLCASARYAYYVSPLGTCEMLTAAGLSDDGTTKDLEQIGLRLPTE